MAGHSKWSQIKRKKAVNDQKRGQIFTKIIRELTVAAREGGGDPNFNPRLRLAVDAAKAANMPQDNIDRAIKRGTGELAGVTYEEVVYEGYGPGGVALYIETLTDNQKRTVAAVRHILDKNGGNLGTAGSVAWQFERMGTIYVAADGVDEDEVFEAAVEAGADDVRSEAGEYVVSTEATALHEVRGALLAAGLAVASVELTMVARSEVAVGGRDSEKLLKLLDALDDQDDVQQVHSNADLDASVLARVS
ncbi:MAG: YebC/PmpR family DNA-binding transcriptional regulator [Gemmatimonadetes bacterium]|nr:YebC/PmpR family DNA-binding transcriptional regulator [Gemmatimonadota bacterium]